MGLAELTPAERRSGPPLADPGSARLWREHPASADES